MVSTKEKVMTNLSANAAETANSAGENTELPDSEKPFKQVVREAYAAGKTRAEIAKMHGVTYQRIFAITKGLPAVDGTVSVGRPRAILEDGTPRVDKIRELFENGMTVGEISKTLGCSYQIVYQATKKQRAALKGLAPEGVEGEEVEESDDESEEEEELEEESEDEEDDEV
jgi:hypothetical protein